MSIRRPRSVFWKTGRRFVPEYFSKAPAPGVHPRLLISPGDIGKLRWLYLHSECGRIIQGRIETFPDVLHTPAKALVATYEALARGDLRALDFVQSPW